MTTRYYTNPVHPGYLADPFVWEYRGEYYAVGTGAFEASGQLADAELASSGMGGHLRIFPMMRSDDFVTWRQHGGAMLPPDAAVGESFWAPEVAFENGTFYLYYSAGWGDKSHQLRVATCTHPMGPFEDIGVPLTDLKTTPFAIDPSPFRDADGQWYLFYATDFLDMNDGYRAGTSIVADRLIGMTRLEGSPRTILRARSDWQRFQAERPMYGDVWDWHTLEGPCVRLHEGRYYCLYSGGRWENESYGVDYGVADHVLGPYSDAGNERGPRLLRTVPNHVVGPGHCSVVVGPDRQTEYLVYHAWDLGLDRRRMCFDRLLWTPDGPTTEGPTWTPQPVAAFDNHVPG